MESLLLLLFLKAKATAWFVFLASPLCLLYQGSPVTEFQREGSLLVWNEGSAIGLCQGRCTRFLPTGLCHSEGSQNTEPKSRKHLSAASVSTKMDTRVTPWSNAPYLQSQAEFPDNSHYSFPYRRTDILQAFILQIMQLKLTSGGKQPQRWEWGFEK